MWPVIAASTWWIWLIPLTILVLMIWAIEDESTAGATAAMVGGMAVIYLFTDVPILWWLREHIVTLLYLAVIYVMIGAGWGLAKWYFYCLNKAGEYEEQRAQLQSNYNTLDASRKAEFTYPEYIARYSGFPPHPGTNKSRITSWMIYWPPSMLWTLLNDPIKHLWRLIYEHFSTLYSKISKHVFGRFSELNG